MFQLHVSSYDHAHVCRGLNFFVDNFLFFINYFIADANSFPICAFLKSEVSRRDT